MSLAKHLTPGSPKRILSLDGGGIRGALTLGYLQKIEAILQEQNGRGDDFRLCDYFDLIGGTSTGAIIAACLATGWRVNDIKEKYFELGGEIFSKKYHWWNIFTINDIIKARYDSAPLEKHLKAVFGDIRLGDADAIKTGLCIVAKRADTNSVWPLINHPGGKYFDSNEGHNKNILLREAVRASAAAPTYFLPQVLDVGGELSKAAFVDGGVSMANNPALQLLMVATLNGFPFRWSWGYNNLFIVSVGTGMSRWKTIPEKIEKNNLLNWAAQMPNMFMQDASWHNQLILQWLSNSDTAWEIDGETGSLQEDIIGGNKQNAQISYQRYNMWLDADSLKSLTGKSYAAEEIEKLTEMSNAENREKLFDLGKMAAEKDIVVNNKIISHSVQPAHFPDTFKI